ncbi:ATP synthase subunit D [Clostridium amazonitimonense]|uniref:ATP synthase subunit D n=1 Tax=Clostridium amazonitimonense TaxID=1499689 RepID=UPI000509ED9C|nr:ATP synthase subunit D [Clostridium amazonitimonense]
MELSWVIQTATMLAIGAIGYFLKTTMNDIKEDIKKNNARVNDVEGKLSNDISKLKEEMNDLKCDLPLVYVLREDFIRIMNNVDDKLDKIYNTMNGGKK